MVTNKFYDLDYDPKRNQITCGWMNRKRLLTVGAVGVWLCLAVGRTSKRRFVL
jgi:hypothetical protein